MLYLVNVGCAGGWGKLYCGNVQAELAIAVVILGREGLHLWKSKSDTNPVIGKGRVVEYTRQHCRLPILEIQISVRRASLSRIYYHNTISQTTVTTTFVDFSPRCLDDDASSNHKVVDGEGTKFGWDVVENWSKQAQLVSISNPSPFGEDGGGDDDNCGQLHHHHHDH